MAFFYQFDRFFSAFSHAIFWQCQTLAFTNLVIDVDLKKMEFRRFLQFLMDMERDSDIFLSYNKNIQLSI